MSKSYNRPSTKNTGTPLPTKYRFLKQGVFIFKPTPGERAKIALGFNIKVSVTQEMEHNPGRVTGGVTWDVTEQSEFQEGDRIRVLPEQHKIENQGASPEPKGLRRD